MTLRLPEKTETAFSKKFGIDKHVHASIVDVQGMILILSKTFTLGFWNDSLASLNNTQMVHLYFLISTRASQIRQTY